MITRQGNQRFDNIKKLSYYIANAIPTTRHIDLYPIVGIRVQNAVQQSDCVAVNATHVDIYYLDCSLRTMEIDKNELKFVTYKNNFFLTTLYIIYFVVV